MAQWAKSVVGQTLKGTYRVERLLGVGGIGAVYVARHVRTGSPCAVKVLHRKMVAATEVYQQFQEEARLVASLRHPHIIPITDIDRDGDTPFLVMELQEGENLQQRLRQRGELPLSQSLDLAAQAGSALQAAHRAGVLHRNLKPENIFLVRQDLGDRVGETVKLADFGLVRLRRALLPDGPPRAEERTLMGLSQYMAPEALKERNAVLDGRADQWALGVVLYRVLSGRLPFEGDSVKEVLRQVLCEEPLPLSQLAPELPAHVVQAISRALSRRKEDRFDGILDFVRALQARSSASFPVPALSDRAISEARPPLSAPVPMKGPAERLRQGSPRPPFGLLAGGLLLAVLLGGGSKLIMKRHRNSLTHSPKEAPAPQIRPSLPIQVAMAGPAVQSLPMDVPATAGGPKGTLPSLRLPEEVPAAEPPPTGMPALPRPVTRAPVSRHGPLTSAPLAPPRQPAAPPDEEPGQETPTLRDAQIVYANGDRQQAVEMALSVAMHSKDPRAAWRFVGTAACALHDMKLATRAYHHVEPGERSFLVSVCQQKGLAYLNGQFRVDDWTEGGAR